MAGYFLSHLAGIRVPVPPTASPFQLWAIGAPPGHFTHSDGPTLLPPCSCGPSAPLQATSHTSSSMRLAMRRSL